MEKPSEFISAIIDIITGRKGKFHKVDYELVTTGKLWSNVKHETLNNGTVTVTMTRELRVLALCLGVYTRERARQAGLKEIFPSNERREIIGMEGCLCVASYLFDNFLEGLGCVTFGKSDNADLEIGDSKIDVKTGTEAYHKHLMINKIQWLNQKRVFDFYVGCIETSEDTVKIHGYATRDDVQGFINDIGWSFQGNACPIPLEILRPIAELKALAKGNKSCLTSTK